MGNNVEDRQNDIMESFQSLFGKEELFARVIECFPYPIQIFSLDGTARMVNKAALEVKSLLKTAVQSLIVEEPVGYLDMVMLEKHARLIATDSGGVQKEAFFHRVPCVTLRDETGWVELVDIGWNTVIPPTSSSAIVNTVRGTLSKHDGSDGSPYGDGTAAKHIVRHLAYRWLC